MEIPQPANLRCEGTVQTFGVDTGSPRFSWNLSHPERNQSQQAFQIIVSSDHEEIQRGIGSQWDSGRVESDESVNVVYGGARLASTSLYYWRVRWWDADGNESGYSDISSFHTAFLEWEEWKAEWISMRNPITFVSTINRLMEGIDRESPQYHAMYLRKTFEVAGPIRHSRIYVSGIGYYELTINGRRVGDRLLDPGQTDYRQIALYSSYDVTTLVRTGENAIGMILGNGRHIEAYGYGKPRGIVQLIIEYQDGGTDIIVSDQTWKTAHGPLMENGMYYGERYDARKGMPGWDTPEFDDSSWDEAEVMDGPPLASQTMPPIRATHTLKPKRLLRPKAGVFVYDFGQNFTGWVRLSVKGPAGTEIVLKHSELLDSNNMLNMTVIRDAEATDVYILNGDADEVYEPRFTYHGFRYVEVTGFPGVPTLENLEGIFVHSDVEQIGRFHCSNRLINDIHRNIYWGQLSNLTSVPTDCPQRGERMGWMGDAQLIAEEAFYNFHMLPFFAKYLEDIRRAQKEDGSLSDVVPPYWPLYPADPAWASAYVTIAWYCYLFSGDTRVINEHFESMKRYIGFLQSIADGYVLKNFGKYGDWCAPGCIEPMKTPAELTSTWYFYHDSLLLARMATVLERQEDTAELFALAENIKQAFNREFLEGGRYATNDYGLLTGTFISQTSQALPLYLDMVPENLREAAVEMLKRAVVEQSDCHVDTGIVGTRYLFDVLTENGMADIAYEVATRRSYPGWGYMVKEGATTLWERWEKLEAQGMNSHNHIMLGSIDAWFYRVIAGLAPAGPGWKRVRIKPHILGDLTYATATVRTVRGEVHVSWEKREDILALSIGIPPNVSADLHVPAPGDEPVIIEGGTVVWEAGRAAGSAKGITPVKADNGYVHMTAGSGFYEFEVRQIR